jgi:hypothetical protein
MRKQEIVLEDHSDRAISQREIDPPRGIEQDSPVEDDPARLGQDEPGDQAEQLRLARARLPEHHPDFPTKIKRDFQAQIRMDATMKPNTQSSG